MSPNEFVPIAEVTGLIAPLGDWVFGNACEAFAKMERPDPAFRISIDLSMGRFGQEELPALMSRTLEEMGLEPARVELELTEGILLEQAHALTERGFSTARECRRPCPGRVASRGVGALGSGPGGGP